MRTSDLKKIIQEEIENIFNEGRYKIDGHAYDIVYTQNGKAYIGYDGILGNNSELVSWPDIQKYSKKYAQESPVLNEDFVEKIISDFFKKLRDKNSKKVVDDLRQKDPDLAKALDILVSKEDEYVDFLKSF